LGPSGVGKTSLLRFIAGLAPPGAAGRVTFAEGGPIAGHAAYMAQQDLLLPWLTAVENATLGARLRGTEPDSDAARALLAQLGLAGHEDALPATLSGGMRQRVALARTLLEDRPVCLLDEPFSTLDAITRHRLQAEAASALAGRTVLLVTHDPLEALRLGHSVLVMSGRPAGIRARFTPAGVPPRDTSEPALVKLQARLLDELAAAAEAGP
jgi:putative hydroxymethylpyrimidine transport system ATP-binding protein